MSKYVYKDIKKQIGNDIYEVGYVNIKIDEFFDGKIIDKRIKKNNNWKTYYIIYKNGKNFGDIYGYNLTKEELIKKFEETLDKLINKN